MLNQGISIRKIAAFLNRSPSTVSREIHRNQIFFKPYSPSIAQTRYQNRRKQCGRKRILLSPKVKEKVRELIQENHWSPEQVSFRLKLEHNPICISYDEFIEKMKEVSEIDLNYFGIAICGSKKKVNKLTGSMPLLQ